MAITRTDKRSRLQLVVFLVALAEFLHLKLYAFQQFYKDFEFIE